MKLRKKKKLFYFCKAAKPFIEVDAESRRNMCSHVHT